ncbi:sensor histidine kinase [Streptomyces thinghirensis]|uniref:Histidine kinase/HSP90-like ATPase domain-containing protein n=1 Tax=Streptomyces thinghirensis TaxID=551547 RepID=A0ABP9TEL5_9ACTN
MSEQRELAGHASAPARGQRALPAHGPAVLSLERQALLVTVVLRMSSAAVAAVVALLGLGSAANPAWVLLSVAAVLVWAGSFGVHTLRGRPAFRFAAGDVVVCTALCLLHGQLVPASVLAASAGSGWVDLIASVTVLNAQCFLRQPHGLLATVVITAAYTVGAPGLREAPVVLLLQGTLSAGMFMLLRRAARSADSALVAKAEARANELARAAARADERDQQRRLHDTVLATLTMVSTGAITGHSTVLRDRAVADLRVIRALGAGTDASADPTGSAAPHGTTTPLVRLDTALRAAAFAARPGLPPLTVELGTVPVLLPLPRRVLTALVDAVAEALTNVARHSGTITAQVRVEPAGTGVIVKVLDAGRGFDPTTVPAHRRGLRESIRGRMVAVGGDALIETRPGDGVHVTLRWPR